ncbi:MAG: exodeoxyribonuclease VII [Psychrobacter sp.]|nr:exodeoxyribonuclease VII [Psychrobacter sp.]
MTTPPRRRKKAAPKTFEAAYHILKDNAAILQQQEEPNIDDLMTIVEESIGAYKICQTRIEAVQKALDEAFSDESLTADNTDDNGSETSDEAVSD